MANSLVKLKAVLRLHLLGRPEIQAKVEGRVYGHHLDDDELGTVPCPLIVLEIKSGSAMYNRVVQTIGVDVYVWSKRGDTECAEVYDLVYAAFQAECVGSPELGVSYLGNETRRPMEGKSPQLRAWWMRGTFAFSGVT